LTAATVAVACRSSCCPANDTQHYNKKEKSTHNYLLQLSLPPHIVPNTLAAIPINTKIPNNIDYISSFNLRLSTKYIAAQLANIRQIANPFVKTAPIEIIISAIIL